MKKEVARLKAEEFIGYKNSTNTYKDKFKWLVTEPIDFEDFWFFKYKFEVLDKSKKFSFGGAPGFKINMEDGIIEDLTWEEFRRLRLSE